MQLNAYPEHLINSIYFSLYTLYVRLFIVVVLVGACSLTLYIDTAGLVSFFLLLHNCHFMFLTNAQLELEKNSDHYRGISVVKDGSTR